MKPAIAIGLIALAFAVIQPARLSVAQSTNNHQVQSSMMSGGCSMMGMIVRQGRGLGMHGRMGRDIADHTERLRVELNILAEQKDAWKQYAGAVETQFENMRSNHNSMMSQEPDGSAIERLEVRISMMETMLAGMSEIKTSLENLYGILDENQKKTIDSFAGVSCRS